MYTVMCGKRKQTFDGFRSWTPGQRTWSLAIAVFDGEPELWWLETVDGLDELKRYYRTMHGREPSSIGLFAPFGG